MKHIFLFFLAFLVFHSFAQTPVNAFANVSAISGVTLTVDNVNETYHSFEDGNYVIIMQMQDNVIGSNTTNVSGFGDLGGIQSAGGFEVAQILSHTESASLPNSVVLASALSNTYNINANASVQLITFRALGSSFTSTASIGTFSWNGTIGGVTAMSVTNVFTLAHNITATGSGFRGGVKNTPNSYTACDNNTYITTLSTRYAGKGEGIYKVTNTGFGAARGKVLNGGGGGNDVNAGGGGGGNYSGGGGGGSGWVSAGTGCSPIAGGLGGLSLGSSISGQCIFMGGGGGGGHENDGAGTTGGVGGGIILIKAGTLATASCAGITISSNGNNAVSATNDGAGGGGAGGTILLNVASFSVAGACPLAFSANGGNGGNSNAGSSGAHGGGGGGGQGAIIYSSAQPTANVTTSTSPGTGGVSCGGCSASLNGSVGTGTVNSGVVVAAVTPLPVEILSFSGILNSDGHVGLSWQTAIEKNNRAFVVEHLSSGSPVQDLATIEAKGSYHEYHFLHRRPAKGMNYYRLRQVDLDGTAAHNNWIEVNSDIVEPEQVLIYPNPAGEQQDLTLRCEGLLSAEIEIVDVRSEIQLHEFITTNEPFGTISLKGIKPGLYILRVKANGKLTCKKLIVLKA